MSFAEVREYQYGDEVRSIDWNVSARLGTPYSKIFEEEREQVLMLLVDISASNLFGAKTKSKQTIATEIAATLAFSAMQNNDKVGALLFAEGVEQYIPPQKGRAHILAILSKILSYQAKPHTTTSIATALQYMSRLKQKKCVCVLISDMMSDNYEQALRMAAKQHDVIGIHLHDSAEAQLPAIGLLPVQHLESGKTTWIDTSNKQQMQAQQAQYAAKHTWIKNIFAQTNAAYLPIATHADYVQALLHFFGNRKK